MKKLKFVTKVKEGKITVPNNDILEGLDLLVTVEPIIVEKEPETAMEKLWKYKIKDFNQNLNPCAPSGLHPAITQEELDKVKDEITKHAFKEEREKEVYDEFAAEEELKPIEEVIITRDNDISITNIDSDRGYHFVSIQDHHELKSALGGAQYTDSFKLTIRSEPLYKELTSIVYHFFTPNYKLVNTTVNLDDYTDTYEKYDAEKEFRKQEEAMKKAVQKDIKNKSDQIEEAVLRGELTPIANEDGSFRYVSKD